MLDRPGLEHASCECYQVVKTEVDRLLSDIPRVATPPTAGRPDLSVN